MARRRRRVPAAPPVRAGAGPRRAASVAMLAVVGLCFAGLAVAIAQTMPAAAPPPPGMADVPLGTQPDLPAAPAPRIVPGTPPTTKRQSAAPVQKDAPVYYQADRADYDRTTQIATLSGHVELWQGDRVLLADRVTYNRATDVAAARGHVVLLEPDGQTVFSDYAELSGGMKDGVMEGLRALLAEGGRLAANGARRSAGGQINELSRAVYSTCDLCAADPTRPPLWQIRAREAIQDKANKRIEYRDAEIEMWGVPVFWLPYLTHPDPTEKRASGILPPNMGSTKRLGVFVSVPYYWVIDGQSDATITPLVATGNGPAMDLQYRRRFNSGALRIDGSVANADGSLGGNIAAKGQFSIDETWRWGFDVNRASSNTYMRDFRIQGWSEILTSRLYVEGFGQGSYARLDARTYQSLSNTIAAQKLPTVAPHAEYSLFGPEDALGGRTTVDMDAFNVVRNSGSSTRRLHLATQWDRPGIGRLGEVWNATVRLEGAAYSADDFNRQPNFGAVRTAQSGQGLATAALMVRWPFSRDAGDWGTQVIEPIVQLVAAPRASSYVATRIPNEDSLDVDFTDASLFSLNRHVGADRLEGGMRANVALHGAWYLRNGTVLDAQVGQAFRTRPDTGFAADSGLRGTASDIVSHLSVSPVSWLDLTSRQRFDHGTGAVRYADLTATVGSDPLRLNVGYLYSRTNPYSYYDTSPPPVTASQPRNELVADISTRQAPWRMHVFARRDLAHDRMSALGIGATYEDECFIFDASFYRRFTSINGDNGATVVLFQVTLKTVGQYGFNAL